MGRIHISNRAHITGTFLTLGYVNGNRFYWDTLFVSALILGSKDRTIVRRGAYCGALPRSILYHLSVQCKRNAFQNIRQRLKILLTQRLNRIITTIKP